VRLPALPDISSVEPLLRQPDTHDAATTQNITIAYGLIAAGTAIAIQDVLKNITGSIIIFTSKLYHVGDRIEINSKVGDVMDLGLFYTTLMEIREWVNGDQATGRIISMPNSVVLNGNTMNYTKDHEFIWEELTIPITYDSNWKQAYDKILRIVRKETKEITPKAEKEISKLGEKYFMTSKSIEPAIYLTLTDNWITFNIRYPVLIRERRIIKDRISQKILKEIEKSKNINIASSSAFIYVKDFPTLKIKK